MGQVDGAQVVEAQGAVVGVQCGVVLDAVQAQPAAAGAGDLVAGPVEQERPDVLAGVGAVDGEPVDVAGVVGGVGPVVGYDRGGRLLTLICRYYPDRRLLRPITGWPTTAGERTRYL